MGKYTSKKGKFELLTKKYPKPRGKKRALLQGGFFCGKVNFHVIIFLNYLGNYLFQLPEKQTSASGLLI
jgi:hypothetical protein